MDLAHTHLSDTRKGGCGKPGRRMFLSARNFLCKNFEHSLPRLQKKPVCHLFARGPSMMGLIEVTADEAF